MRGRWTYYGSRQSVQPTPKKFRQLLPSALESQVEETLKSFGLKFEVEFRFCKERRWRFDFALPAQRIGIECEGGIWSHGRHTRGIGYTRDCEKYNRAALDGWRVLRYTSGNIDDFKSDLAMAIAVNSIRL